MLVLLSQATLLWEFYYTYLSPLLWSYLFIKQTLCNSKKKQEEREIVPSIQST